ncbi:hypothetical protein [uncultured Gemmiger sp.]|uniref:hypothetical protein n=1 Tax=uncultured Gemmiger sp. TaxID=1623490 RepID=UPI0025FBC88F|nr:hypothetical protein [uncultured Gemmiger sp.]
MIRISSQSPTLPSHNSLNYELLSLMAICGEVPCTCSARLTASESYRKKVVTSLTHDKLLRIFSRHHLRGYRLGVRGKRLLLQQEPERFAFYLSGCSDTNAIKSEVSRRVRLHRIAQTYVTMLNAGAMIYRDEKPPIFSPAASGSIRIEQPCFYDSREMKEAELEMLKIRGSRMAGALFTSSRVFAVYNSMGFLPVFEPQVEQRAKVMLEQICRTKISFNLKASGLLLSDSMDILRILLEHSRTRKLDHFLLNDGYEHFYFLTNDSYGEALLQLLCHPEIIAQVNAALLQEFQSPPPNSRLECDAVDDSGSPVLFCYLPDIPRLYRFVSALDLLNITGILVCFDFQADALRPLCGDNIELQIIDFQKFKMRFLSFD